MNGRSGTAAVPGRALLHPLPAAACLLIACNDIWLRRHAPGFWSGKLSDVGICVLLPVLLVALWEWPAWLFARIRGRTWEPAGRTAHVGAACLAASYYAALELWPAFGLFHAWWLNHLIPWWRFRPGTADPTDLVALVFVPVALWHLHRCTSQR